MMKHSTFGDGHYAWTMMTYLGISIKPQNCAYSYDNKTSLGQIFELRLKPFV